jgi:aspartyl-tRNA(Asn)/glutamyl-tRNA(Gln) amidotransferase subunit A
MLGLAGRVIARPPAGQLVSISSEARTVFEQAAETLRSHGSEIVEITLPEWDALNALTAIVFASEVAATHRSRLAADPGAYSPEVRERMAAGFVYGATDYFDALRVRARLTRGFVAAVFARADALLLPSAPDTAPLLDEVLPGVAVRRYDAGAYTLATSADPGRFTRALNYLGLPALALPAGFAGEGVPVGVQLVGRPFGDGALFAIGEAFQQVTDHHRRRPAAHRFRPQTSNI